MARPKLPPRLSQRPNGIYYVLFFNEETGEADRESLLTKDEAEARERFSRWLVRKDPSLVEGPSVRDLLNLYRDKHVDKVCLSRKDAHTLIDRHLIPAFGDMAIDDMDGAAVAEFIEDKRDEGYADGTIRNMVHRLSAAYSYAARRAAFGVKSVPLFPLPGTSPVKEDWITREEFDQIMTLLRERRVAQGHDKTSPTEVLCQLAFRTAARYTACMELTWDRVDFTRGVIDYRTKAWLKLPKDRQTKRRVVVPISQKLRPYLEALRQEFPNETHVVPRWRTAHQRDFEFLSTAMGKPIGPHLLRRSWATLASMAGVQMTEIARVMGNTVQQAEARYARFAPGYLQSAVDAAE